MSNIPISSSLEDYLEAIAELLEGENHVHAKDIAAKLQVKMPSVTNALQALSARDMILYQPHAPVRLTAAGAELAAVIRHRHAGLKRFFAAVLKLDDESANATACKIEHLVGEREMSRFVALSDAILEREDCAGLRTYLAETMPQICADANEELISLDHIPLDASGIVVRVGSNLKGVKKFAALGLVPGTLVQMEGHAPFGDLLRVRVMGSTLSLRARDAAYIWVKPTD